MMKNFAFYLVCLLCISILSSCGGSNSDIQKDPTNIDSLLVKYPDSLPILVRHGKFYYKKYIYNKAMSSAAKAFRLDSNNLDARLLYANVLNNRPNRTVEEVITARRHFQYVFRKQPKNTEALVSLASTFSMTQDFDKSFQYINEALRIDPKYRDAYVLKGTNYIQLGKMELAKSSYETAVQQDPQFYEGYLFLGTLYQNENNPICIEYYTTASKLRPKDLEILYALAYAKQIYNRVPEAQQIYREMLEIDSTYAMPLFQQGYIKHFVEKQLDSAMTFYNRALVVEPRFVEAWHNLGMLHEGNGDRSKALQAYAKALKYNPNFELSRKAADLLR